MWDGFNKRKFPRLHLACEVIIHPQGRQKAIKTTTENVGMGGVAVLLNEPLERFERCQVSLEVQDGEKPLQGVGRCVWVIPSHDLKTSKKQYDVGIEFLDIDDAARQKLQTFLMQPRKKS